MSIDSEWSVVDCAPIKGVAHQSFSLSCVHSEGSGVLITYIFSSLFSWTFSITLMSAVILS